MWTHDSVGLGEDGPTHQPIEHYAALRAIPHLWVIRPADANETAVAWRVALEREDGPVALLLSRQSVPVLDRSRTARRPRGLSAAPTCCGIARGDGAAGAPELILISTGTEVYQALAAAEALAGEGVRMRVVSMPCMELFEAQSPEYREQVLPASSAGRGSAIEPGASMSWWRWVGPTATSSDSTASAPRRRVPPCWRSSDSLRRTSPSARGRCSARDD